MAAEYCVCLCVAASRYGGGAALWVAVRPIFAMLVILPLDVFLLGLLYYTLRDSLCGTLWARRSRGRALTAGFLIAAVFLASGSVFVGIAYGDFARAVGFIYGGGSAAALTFALACVFYAVRVGPSEIRDTVWGCLKLN
jgi:hypothetical protein